MTRVFVICVTLLGPLLIAANPKLPVHLLAMHAHRYQDFQKKQVRCEVFGEIKNLGPQSITQILMHVEFLDRNKKPVYQEQMELALRVIKPGNAKGEQRPVQPQEIGNFIQDTKECPENWQEGRIKFEIKSFTTQ